MRQDKKGKIHTLEEDIVKTWKKHGLTVTVEKVEGGVWTIKARRNVKKKKPIKSKPKNEEPDEEEDENDAVFSPPVSIPSSSGGSGFGGGQSGGAGASGSW